MQLYKANSSLDRHITPILKPLVHVRRITAVHRCPAGVTAAAAVAGTAAVAVNSAQPPPCRRLRCRSTAGDSSSTAEHEQQQSAAAAASIPNSSSSSSSSPFSFSEPELKQIWDSVSRSLLKLGKSGMSDTHTNSLKELLAAHKLVKVQFNAAHSEDAAAAAADDLQQRLQGAGAVLQVKGRTLLVALTAASAAELLALSEASAAGTALWKAKRQMKKAEAAEKRANAAGSRK